MTLEVASAIQNPAGCSPWPRRLAYLSIGTLAAIFLYAGRHELTGSLSAAGRAEPIYLGLGLLLSIVGLAAYASLLRGTLRAFGVRLSWGTGLRLGAAVHFSNIAVPNSGGLGGLPLVVAQGRRAGKSAPAAAGGLIACAQLGHLVFAAVLTAAIVVAALTGELSRLELLAAGIFVLYTIASQAAVFLALRSERAFTWLHTLPARLRRLVYRRIGRDAPRPDGEAASQLFASISEVRRHPRAFVWPAASAAAVEVAGVAGVWVTLLAFGVQASVSTALIAYSATVLFATVGLLPAGIGFAEAGLGLALANAGTERSVIPLVVVTYRLFETWLPFAIGALAAHSLAHEGRVARPRPGLSATRRRKLTALSVAALGSLDVLLSAVRHPLIRIGPMHQRIPHAAVESSRYVLLAAGIAMLASVPGLLHGKRQAWLISSVAVAAALLSHPLKRTDYIGIAANAATLAMLLAFVRCFPARSDPVRMRQGVYWLVLGALGVFVYGVAGLYLLDRHFAGGTTFADALEDGVRLLFVLPPSTIEPATRHGAWFIDSVRASAIGVLLVSIYHLVHPVIHRVRPGREERRRVAAVLEEWATTATAFFHLLPDKSYFFASRGEAFIGYRVVGHTAVALAGPIGEPAARRRVVEEFAEFCDLNGWSFCFHQVTQAAADELRSAGLQALKTGEEAIIPIREFQLSGKSFKHVRNVVNRLTRDGYSFEVVTSPLDDVLVAELERVSESWLAAGRHRERAFSLGCFSRAYVRETDVAIVRSPEGRVEGFANLVPAYRSPDGNFDMMRRRIDAPDGVMDFLFVGMIEHFRAAGAEGMNLGFAPLANIEGNGVAASALRLFYQRGGRAFNFQGLRRFKEKWDPRWEPRYLVFRSEVQLPGLALAVVRAGERSGRLPIEHSLRRRPQPMETAPGSV